MPHAYLRAIHQAASAALSQIPRTLRSKKLVKKGCYRLEVAIVGSAASRKLNAHYRGKDRATDVLSFSRLEGPSMPIPGYSGDIGELVLCWNVTQQQAKAYQVSIKEELQRITVHGVLHLFGYDHETSPTDAKRMFALQDRILESLGVWLTTPA